MEWLVRNAVNRDVERQHLNKILQDIKAVVDKAVKDLNTLRLQYGDQDIKTIVGEMVSNNTERGVAVSYNPQKKTLDFVAKDFTIALQGAVTGEATVTALSNVTISTELASSIGAPADGNFYWQYNGEWELVLPPVADLQFIEGSGILVRAEGSDSGGYELRTIEGTTDQIDVANGTGVDGNPTISLADLADSGDGVLLGIERDAKGRISGTKPVVEGSGITITDTGTEIEIASTGGGGSGGILPVVTGEIVDDQPVFVYADDGSLIYTEIV